MQANHGPQGHFGFADEQADNVNGVYPATPVQNNYSTTMRQPITYGNAQTQQGRLRGQPQFIGQQQVVNFNDNLYTLPMRNHPGVTMNFAPGNTQLAQQIPQSQPRFINQQMINAGGWTPEVVVFGNNPYTMDATTELHHSNGQQPDQFLNTQNDQPAQIYQSDEEYQHGQNYHHCQDQQQYGQNQQRRQNYQRVQSYHNSPGSNNSLNNQNCARNPVAHCYQPVTGLPPQAARAGNHPRSGICSQARQATTAPQAATNPTRATTNPPRAATASRSTTNAPQVATTPQSAIHPQAANPTQSAISTQARLPLNTGSLTASAPQVRSAESHESSLGTEATERFEDEVKRLIEEKATTFKAHIKSHNEVAQYKQAVWKARLSGGNHEKKCGDYPKDAAGELEIIQRIFDAIVNVDGEQDPASETGDFANCLAVKIIKGLSTIDVELLAHDFLEDTRKIQSGEPVLPPESKVVQEDTFAAKVDKLVAALSVNKLLCRSATTGRNWVSRIAADPAGERHQKLVNVNNNLKKAKVLAAESLKKGTARKGKGKGKRAAAAEPEAQSQPEAAAEVSDVVRATQAAA